ncbi:MAG: hypothetical protein ABL909_10375 [Sphingopyxis sp.]
MRPQDNGPQPPPVAASGTSRSIITAAEGENPGVINAGEIREALRFAGHVMPTGGIQPASAGGISASLRDHDLIEIEERQQLARENQTALVRSISSLVDRRTGLLLSSRIETRAAGHADGPPMSVRTWRLTPMDSAFE